MHTSDRRQFLQTTAASLLTLPLASRAAMAQHTPPASNALWPTRPVNVLVGFPGGSSPDTTARILVDALRKSITSQPLVVENRPGAGGNVAAAALARAANQHTLGVMINGNLTIARLLNPKLSFDPATDFAPIALIGASPYVLTVNAQLAQGMDPAAFLAKAREAGGTWNYGSPGLGTVAHLGMELLKSRTDIQAVHVPYQGNPQALQAVVSGEIQMALLPPAMVWQQAEAGLVALIGITSAQASPLTGDLPTLQSLGATGLDLEVWNAVAVPASMPPAIQALVREAVAGALALPETRQQLRTQGWVVGDTSAEALRARMAADAAALGAIIREQNIQVGG